LNLLGRITFNSNAASSNFSQLWAFKPFVNEINKKYKLNASRINANKFTVFWIDVKEAAVNDYNVKSMNFSRGYNDRRDRSQNRFPVQRS